MGCDDEASSRLSGGAVLPVLLGEAARHNDMLVLGGVVGDDSCEVAPRLDVDPHLASSGLAGGEAAFEALAGPARQEVLQAAAQVSFQTNALLPALLIAVFGVIWLWDRRRAD